MNESNGPPQEPQSAVREIAAQLHEDLSKSSLKHADHLVDKLEALRKKISSLSAKPLKEMKETVLCWRDSIEFALNDCKDGFIATGDMAICSSWYTPKVEPKLKTLFEEFKKAEHALTSVQLEPFQELGRKLATALNTITPTIKNLRCLPDRVSDIANSVGMGITRESTTDSVATTCQSQKSQESANLLRHLLARLQPHLDCPGTRIIRQAEMNASLQDLERCLTHVPELVDATQSRVRMLTDFFSKASDRIKDAFRVPVPCGCMSAYVMDQPHWALFQLNKHTAKVQSDLRDFAQLNSLLDALKHTLINLDVTTIGAPVKQFSSLASERLARLNKVVGEVNLAGFPLPPGNSVAL